MGSATSLKSLNLQNNQLTESIPSSLGSLANLEYLYLHNNQLSGTIPAALGNISSLLGLCLDNNLLTGEIPPQIGNLTNLVYLCLGVNQLTGSIPDELGDLTNLKWLYLHRNELSGSIPSDLGDLAELSRLRLHGNQLTGAIPTELGGLSSLQELGLGDNQFSGSLPTELGDLTHLKRLYLHRLGLTGSIPDWMGGLSLLEELDLSENRFSGSIPSDLGDLASLEELFLDDNRLTGAVPATLTGHANLEELKLHRNLLDGNISVDLTALELLTLDYAENGSGPAATVSANALTAPIAWSLSGDEAGVLAVANTGAVNFNTPPDYESLDYAENGSGPAATVSANALTAPIAWSLSGDEAGVLAVANTGAVNFNTPPDYESPPAVDPDDEDDQENRYQVEVTAADGVDTTKTGSLWIEVYVRDAAETIILSLDTEEISEIDASATTVTATVIMDGAASRMADATVSLTLTGTAAGEGTDYTVEGSPSVTVAAWEASGMGQFSITPIDDDVIEGTETIVVEASANGLLGNSVTISLLDQKLPPEGSPLGTEPTLDQAMLSLSGPDAPVSEGGDAEFTVALSHQVAAQVQVDWAATVEGSDTAQLTDLVDTTVSGSVIFAADSSAGAARNFTVTILDDTIFENSETFTVSLGMVTVPPAFAALVAVDPSASSFTATIADNDEPPIPTITGPATVNYGENSATAVATYQVFSFPEDPDPVWSVSGDDGGEFRVVGGKLYFVDPPDYEAPADQNRDNVYSLTVEVSRHGKTGVLDVSVTVLDVAEQGLQPPGGGDTGGDTGGDGRALSRPANGAPSFLEGASALRSVTENAQPGQDIGAPLEATDPEGASLTYSLAGESASLFTLDQATGQLATNVVLDYEARVSHELFVTASDGTKSTTIAVTIQVTNLEEAGLLTLAPGTPRVGAQVTASLEDPDGGVDNLTWTWEKSSGQAAWSVISGAEAANYIPVAEDAGHYLRVTAAYDDDEGPGKTAQAVTSPTATHSDSAGAEQAGEDGGLSSGLRIALAAVGAVALSGGTWFLLRRNLAKWARLAGIVSRWR